MRQRSEEDCSEGKTLPRREQAPCFRNTRVVNSSRAAGEGHEESKPEEDE